ncbi:hypothetical protein [Dermabacter vaginalis]|uniref:hypothetical protein n=1 Tax=Dermabacter vaginalis TaxID=1630135 RepID=UPI001EF6C02D|nr:hypothetical protein [Dermabacter vaginalis]MCG7444133.1 hypothetical protein [Dermabacter vaginalis]
MIFDVPEIENPAVVASGAADIRTAGETVEKRMKDTAGAWQPIRGQYDAPEAAQVHQAMDTPEQMAAEVKASAGQIAARLDAYSVELDLLQARKAKLEIEIAQFVSEKLAATVGLPGASAALAAREAELHEKCRQLRRARDHADQDCAGSISGIVESTGDAIGKKFLRAITRGNDIEGDAGTGLQGLKLGTDFYKYRSMSFFYANGTIEIKEDWAPKYLKRLAGKGKFGKGLVKGLTGWDASNVVDPKAVLPESNPLSPLAKPTTATGTLQAFVARSTLKLQGESSRVPHKHSQAVTDGKWKSIKGTAKFMSKSGNYIGAAAAGVDSWQTDSHVNPDMGNVQKGARAGALATGAGVGGWAGGKAGAAMGAAIGSFGGPIGTVAGGVVGGIIGGVAGGSAGSWLAKKGNEKFLSQGIK